MSEIATRAQSWQAEWMALQFRLMSRRRALGIRQPDLAKTLRISRSKLQRCEHGKAVPDALELFRWADALGISITSTVRDCVRNDAIEARR